ncbi:GDP-mannose 4,6-dehydratase [Methanoculleus sp.]|uniref:GDP-mannose 4,6-dehydratase n=1 Tax=Methanoculleus sp. TaxID=90427 RepID=UPI0025E87D3E|nr:GDP-mannose 4,6-dehydratase [Methanoculleus sp.]MCK9319851.1 GDP-mannose 4,6-dehydratase [Methanoculleus sp.]
MTKNTMTNNPTIVLTGGLGFIFSHVTEHFVKKGWNVIVIDNCSTGSHPEIINGSFQFILMDISDQNIIDKIISINPDYIIHAAANSDVDESILSPLFVVRQNTLGNLYIFEAARKCSNLKKLVYANTDEIFGECRTQKKEDEILFPRNPYSASKATGALFRYAYDNSYPFLTDKTAETRFCNVFGPRQDPRKIIPRIIQSLVTGEAVPVHNKGVGKREYIYVKNIPSVIEKVLLNGNRSYNITNNDLFSVNEIIEIIEKITGKIVPKCDGIRPGMDSIYQMDSLRIKLDLGWKLEYTFEEGIKELLKTNNLCQ